jgi:hypothetical protein
MYMDQSCTLKLDQVETRSVKTRRGIRPGSCSSPILFNLYIEYLTKDSLGGFGDFKIRQIICNVKYADNLVLLDKDDAVLQGMTERLTEIGRCYKMNINVEKNKVISIFR